MRKVFLDCGAFDGCSVRMFLDTHPEADQFEIFSFEPNPHLAKYHPVPPSKFINRAVWVRSGKITFFAHGSGGGSTLIKVKSERNNRKAQKRPSLFDVGEAIEIRCINLSKWIKKHFKPDNYIILKMDIEGAEYEILDRMIKDKTLSYIDILYCEFHRRRCGVSKLREHNIMRAIEKLHIPIHPWNAMTKDYLQEMNCAEFKQANEI